MTQPLPLGTKVPGFGKVAAIRFDGERYYFLIDHCGTVSFMPSDVIESLIHGGCAPSVPTDQSPKKENA